MSYDKIIRFGRTKFDLHVLLSHCDTCEGRLKGCKYYKVGKNSIFLDYQPDVWYDMPCSCGESREIEKLSQIKIYYGKLV